MAFLFLLSNGLKAIAGNNNLAQRSGAWLIIWQEKNDRFDFWDSGAASALAESREAKQRILKGTSFSLGIESHFLFILLFSWGFNIIVPSVAPNLSSQALTKYCCTWNRKKNGVSPSPPPHWFFCRGVCSCHTDITRLKCTTRALCTPLVQLTTFGS